MVHHFTITRPKLVYGQQGLDWIVGPEYSLGVFSMSPIAPLTLSSVDDPDWPGGEGQGGNKQTRHKQTLFITDCGF